MTMTDEEEAKLKADLAQSKQQLTDLLAKAKADEKRSDDDAAEKGRNKKTEGKLELDPDVVKEVATLKEEIADIKKRLGDSKSGAFKPFNLFGE